MLYIMLALYNNIFLFSWKKIHISCTELPVDWTESTDNKPDHGIAGTI